MKRIMNLLVFATIMVGNLNPSCCSRDPQVKENRKAEPTLESASGVQEKEATSLTLDQQISLTRSLFDVFLVHPESRRYKDTLDENDLGRMKELLNAGADPNFKHTGYGAKLQVWKHQDVLNLFVQYGFDLNSRRNGNEPFFFAATAAVLWSVRNRGIDVDAMDGWRKSLLMIVACCDEGVEIVEALVHMGANLNLRDCDGCTALDLVQQKRKDYLPGGDFSHNVLDAQKGLESSDKIIDILQHSERIRRLGGIKLPFSMPKK